MILNDKWIKANSWIFDPYDETMVNPASIDLRWSGRYRFPSYDVKFDGLYKYRTLKTYEKDDLKIFWTDYREAEKLEIHPHDFVLLDTLETLQIPTNVCGLLMLKSSTGRFGIEHHHAGFFDPGFGLGNPSTATLEITNTSPFILEIKRGQPLVQMVFFMAEEPEKDYRFTGRYNGQRVPEGAR